MNQDLGKDLPKDVVAEVRALKIRLRGALEDVDRLRGYKQYLIERLTRQEDECAAEIEKIQQKLKEFTSRLK